MSVDEVRKRARMMAHAAIENGVPLDWFEPLYRAAEEGSATVPWADMAPNPHLVSWDGLAALTPGRALVVGCGYGDDAEWLQARGWSVTAFDISPTAIDGCRRRYPATQVDYQIADLLAQLGWRPFDFVFEAYTVQVLPPESAERRRAVTALRALTGKHLLVIARGREADEDAGQMPWPLTLSEIEAFVGNGLTEVAVEDFLDTEEPPVRRFRALFARR